MCQIVGEQVDVRFDLAAELPLVEMDPHQFERVLRAIAVHEREMMPQGGRMTVITEADRHPNRTDVVVRVIDTAVQHTLRTPEPIFTGKKPSRGAGLALTTAHGILQQSGGTFSVAPGAGRGAVITLTLPARDAGGYLPRT